jgi:trans-aconitate methyltransferase
MWLRVSAIHLALASQLLCAQDEPRQQPSFQGYERILHVGCGSGLFSSQLAQEVPDGMVVGVDVDPSLIQLAEQTYDPDLFSNLQFLVCDPRELTFEAKFDWVVAAGGLDWAADLDRLLDPIARALKAGGRMMVTLSQEPLAVFFAADRVARDSPWQQAFSDYQSPVKFRSREEYAGALSAAGLTLLRLAVDHDYLRYSSKEELIASLAVWLPHQMQVAADQRPAFLEAVVNRLILDDPGIKGEEGFSLIRMITEVEGQKRGPSA